MGYRSEVCIVISHRHLGSQKGLIVVPVYPFSLKDMFDYVLGGKEANLYYAEDTKWYSEDPAIAAAEEFLHTELDPEDYLLLRIGEDQADIETDGCFWSNEFHSRVVRRIDFEDKEIP